VTKVIECQRLKFFNNKGGLEMENSNPKKVEAKKSPLRPGTAAPDFALHSTPDQMVRLSEFRGKPAILVFYPADWSPVCSDQLALGISTDGIWTHLAFAQDRKLQFPLLSDFEHKGAVARAYGVYREQDGYSERALFVIDGNGTIRWSYVSPVGVNPGADGILRALEELEQSR
jgi:peroxiredoxin